LGKGKIGGFLFIQLFFRCFFPEFPLTKLKTTNLSSGAPVDNVSVFLVDLEENIRTQSLTNFDGTNTATYSLRKEREANYLAVLVGKKGRDICWIEKPSSNQFRMFLKKKPENTSKKMAEKNAKK
jgi:hypothetical protein